VHGFCPKTTPYLVLLMPLSSSVDIAMAPARSVIWYPHTFPPVVSLAGSGYVSFC
jgi:hypothetical protein